MPVDSLLQTLCCSLVLVALTDCSSQPHTASQDSPRTNSGVSSHTAFGCSLEPTDGGGGATSTFGPLGEPGTVIDWATVDGSSLYIALSDGSGEPDGAYVATNTFVRMPIDCGPASVLATRSSIADTWVSGVYQLTEAGGRLYVLMGDGIYSLPTGGGALRLEQSLSQEVASSASFVVVTDAIDWLDGSGGLWTVATGGGHTARQLGQAEGGSSASPLWTSLATDGTNLYITAAGLNDASAPSSDGTGYTTRTFAATGSILAIPVSGGPITTLVTGRQHPTGIFLAAGALYWSEASELAYGIDSGALSGPIVRLDLPSGTPTVVAPAEFNVSGIRLIGTTLYWVNQAGDGGSALLRKLPAGGTASTIAEPYTFGSEPVWVTPSGALWQSLQSPILYGVALRG